MSMGATNLIIKVTVATQFVGLLNLLGLFVTLEPGYVLFMEPPTLIFQFLGSKIPHSQNPPKQKRVLLNRFLLIVKHEKQSVDITPSHKTRIDDRRMRDLWVILGRGVRRLRRIPLFDFIVKRIRGTHPRSLEHFPSRTHGGRRHGRRLGTTPCALKRAKQVS
jgi:hypothetical protein